MSSLQNISIQIATELLKETKLKIYVDIDETICYYKAERKYPEAIPIKDRIEKINKLFHEGHEITYYTARGATTGS